VAHVVDIKYKTCVGSGAIIATVTTAVGRSNVKPPRFQDIEAKNEEIAKKGS
jgi:hypothetical protein